MSKKALLFPGQGSQSVGMGKYHFDSNKDFQRQFKLADEILGYSLSDIMFEGPAETLQQTEHTQPAIFLHSVALFDVLDIKPDMVAGHSLGEFSALTASGALSFEGALKLVRKRGQLMQQAGQQFPGTMAAVIGMDDGTVSDVCERATTGNDSIVVPANFNCPGQLVISGHETAVDRAMALLKEKGCRITKKLPVSGAFHSPLMQPAFEGLQSEVENLSINTPDCPVYANFTAAPTQDTDEIRSNIMNQLLNPVCWTQTLQNMKEDGAEEFIEIGPGKVLQGLVKRMYKGANISGHQ
jgi:[acyl-carrier-protein] S-malonyltransferase